MDKPLFLLIFMDSENYMYLILNLETRTLYFVFLMSSLKDIRNVVYQGTIVLSITRKQIYQGEFCQK